MTSTSLNPMGEFFERLGHKIVQTETASWYEVQSGALFSFPYYKLIEPQQSEIDRLLQEHKLKVIRYPTSINNFGFVSTLAVNTNPNYDLSNQHQKARNQTRRGLENCTVEQIGFNYLIENGLLLNKDTAQRQGRESQYADPNYWQKYCQAAQATTGVSAWGAFIGGKLAAFLVAIEVDDWVEWVVNHSATSFRDKYPNNALVLKTAQYFFKEKKYRGICYGLGSLEVTSDLDHFKNRMGWTLQPIKQRLIFSKKMRLVASLAQEPCLKVLSRLFPKSYAVRKSVAIFRLYQQQTYCVPHPSGEQKDLADNS